MTMGESNQNSFMKTYACLMHEARFLVVVMARIYGYRTVLYTDDILVIHWVSGNGPLWSLCISLSNFLSLFICRTGEISVVLQLPICMTVLMKAPV